MRLLSLTLLLSMSMLGIQTNDKSVVPTQAPRITLNSDVVISDLSPSAFRTILNAAIDNRIPIGIIVDSTHRLCRRTMNGGRRRETLTQFVSDINLSIPGYKAQFDGAVLNVYPTDIEVPTESLLKLRIPEFRSGPDSHQGLGVNLWMFIRAMIAPGEGTAFVGASSTSRETVNAIETKNQRVDTILNAIIVKGSGGAWVLQSAMVKDLSPKTLRPYEVLGYSGEEQSLRNLSCE